MANPLRFLKTNWVKASESFRQMRALRARIAAEKNPKKLAKIEAEFSDERRKLLRASAILAGAAAVPPAVASAFLAVSKITSDRMDALPPVYERNKHLFPLSYDRLFELVNDSGLSGDEIGSLLARDGEAAGLYKLYAYGLADKAQRNGELSGRYNQFLTKWKELLLSDRVRFNLNNELTSASAAYDFPSDTLDLNPESFLKQMVPSVSDGSMIHEPYHIYEDTRGDSSSWSRIEVLATLAESDLLSRVDPRVLRPDSWARLLPTTSGVTMRFYFPSRTVEDLKDRDEGDSYFEDIMLEARQRYLLFSMMVFSTEHVDKKHYEDFRARASTFPKEDAYASIERDLQTLAGHLKNRPLKDYISCAPSESEGELAIYHVDDQLTAYGILASFLVFFAVDNGDFEYAERTMNKYFMDLWMEPRNSLIDTDFDLAGMKKLKR